MSKIGLWKKAILVFGFFVFCAAGFYVLKTNNTIKRFDLIKTIDKIKNTNRWMFYKNTVDIIKQYPVLGVGLEIGNLNEKYDKLNTKERRVDIQLRSVHLTIFYG